VSRGNYEAISNRKSDRALDKISTYWYSTDGVNLRWRTQMPCGKPLVVVTRKLPDGIETRMMELFDVRLNLDDTPMNRAQLIEAVETADILVPTLNDVIDANVLSHVGDNFGLIASYGNGVDHIDLAIAKEKNVFVSNTPDVLTEDTADMTMALILALPRRLSEAERLVRAGKWKGWQPTLMQGHRIYGKRLGIVGMGRIGQAVAKRARGFGLSVHYHNRNPVHLTGKVWTRC
jgi:glyoxylate reductase